MRKLIFVFLCAASIVSNSYAVYIGGDAIGTSNSSTNNTGGLSAVYDTINVGQPAVLISLTGEESLSELRVIVFAIPNANVGPRFDLFDYKLDIWSEHDYVTNLPPTSHIDLGDPTNVSQVTIGNTIVPGVVFGNAGVAGNNANTYDLKFSLSGIFSQPLATGNWVLGFQSYHSISQAGSLRVSGSTNDGPTALYSRDDLPRSVLGGIHWGISLTATTSVQPGDFNNDGNIDAADYVMWRNNVGSINEAPIFYAGDNFNGVDSADYSIWRSLFSLSPMSGVAIPEPNYLLLILFVGVISELSRRTNRPH